MRSPGMLLAPLLLMAAGQSAANCQCLCVDGALKTVCNSAAEMAGAGDLCRLKPALQCPEAMPAEGQTYEPPHEGAVNCRDADVQDPASGERIVARVCDMRPHG